MVRGKLLSGMFAGLGIAGVAGLQPLPVSADDRMQLGVTGAKSIEFQSQVGDRVFFADASAELGSRGRLAVEAQAAWLARHPSLAIVVEGHADDAGAASHNLEMSERRAEVVRRRLIQLGIAPERIHTVAYGRRKLLADCPLPACAAQNRRAVILVVPATEMVDNTPAAGPGDARARRAPRRLN
jgi:outer membrane protein OmpA-like peptidoglycan-associated protein